VLYVTFQVLRLSTLRHSLRAFDIEIKHFGTSQGSKSGLKDGKFDVLFNSASWSVLLLPGAAGWRMKANAMLSRRGGEAGSGEVTVPRSA
jgi:hypothetical protein